MAIMPRMDIWDAAPADTDVPISAGFPRGLEDKYTLPPARELGAGGFGSVRIAVEKSNGKEFACKSITKRLDIPGVSAEKQNQHLDNIKREVAILRKLRGTLNVVHLVSGRMWLQ